MSGGGISSAQIRPVGVANESVRLKDFHREIPEAQSKGATNPTTIVRAEMVTADQAIAEKACERWH